MANGFVVVSNSIPGYVSSRFLAVSPEDILDVELFTNCL